MAYVQRRCAECGAPYSPWHTFCAACGEALVKMPPAEEELLDGVPLADWHVFIDKNASRYMELFQKHKDKKVFFHMNWAAMFFNVYWMFYRKMYKYALFFMAAWLLFILAVSTVALVALKPDVEAADRILAPYSQYLEENDGQLYGDIAYESTDIRYGNSIHTMFGFSVSQWNDLNTERRHIARNSAFCNIYMYALRRTDTVCAAFCIACRKHIPSV